MPRRSTSQAKKKQTARRNLAWLRKQRREERRQTRLRGLREPEGWL